MGRDEHLNIHNKTDVSVVPNVDSDPRLAVLKNIEKINEYLSSPDNQNRFLERQKQILNRPTHYFFDQNEAGHAEQYIGKAQEDGFLVVQTNMHEDMFWQQALGSILEQPELNIDLLDDKQRRNFSTTLVSHGIERDKNILVVVRGLHRLDASEREGFFGKLVSADMKAFGGVRELDGARKIQFIGVGETNQLEDVDLYKLFHASGDPDVTYDESVARTILASMQSAFKALEVHDSAWIRSPRGTGKSTALTALRQQFHEELYTVKLDKIIGRPEDVYDRKWVTKEGQIVILDRAEVLQGDSKAIQHLVDTFRSAIFLESSETVSEEQ